MGLFSKVGDFFSNIGEEVGQFVERTFLPESVKEVVSDIPGISDLLEKGWLGSAAQQLTNEGQQYAGTMSPETRASRALALPLALIGGPALLGNGGLNIGELLGSGGFAEGAMQIPGLQNIWDIIKGTGGGVLDMIGNLLGGGNKLAPPPGMPQEIWNTLSPQEQQAYYKDLGLDAGGGGNVFSNLLNNLFGGGGGSGSPLSNIANTIGDLLGGGAGSAGGGGFSPYTPYNVPQTPQFLTAEDIMKYAMTQGKQQFPEAYGAQEKGIADLGQLLNIGPEYFQQFQPTSLEEAVANKLFSTNLEQAKRVAGQRASKAGIESAFPELFARAISPTITSIGEYLGNQGNTRALNALQTRLGAGQQLARTSPFDTITPYANILTSRSDLQKSADYETSLKRAEEAYRTDLAREEENLSKRGLTSSLIGGGIGSLLGIDPSIASQIGNLIGGGYSYPGIGNLLGQTGLPQKKTGQMELVFS